MYSLRPRHLALLSLFLFALSPANAVPVHHRRQDPSPTTLMTQQTTDTVAGQMTQTCVIKLTPITDDQGNPAVQEVKTCTVTMNNVNNGSSGGSDSSSSSTTTTADSSSSTDTSGSNSGSSSTDTSGSSSTDTSGSSSATATASAGGGAVSDNGVTSIPLSAVAGGSSATDSGATASATPGGTNDSGAAVVAGSVLMIPASAVSTSTSGATNVPVAASAAEQASASSSAFAVPGQKLQVLPIGLGVFAGISVIALIVVGLVTYERTKYRKAFRARKLAESGQAMGYGGMAQR